MFFSAVTFPIQSIIFCSIKCLFFLGNTLVFFIFNSLLTLTFVIKAQDLTHKKGKKKQWFSKTPHIVEEREIYIHIFISNLNWYIGLVYVLYYTMFWYIF